MLISALLTIDVYRQFYVNEWNDNCVIIDFQNCFRTVSTIEMSVVDINTLVCKEFWNIFRVRKCSIWVYIENGNIDQYNWVPTN